MRRFCIIKKVRTFEQETMLTFYDLFEILIRMNWGNRTIISIILFFELTIFFYFLSN